MNSTINESLFQTQTDTLSKQVSLNSITKETAPVTIMKSLIIIDSHRLFREGIRLFLEKRDCYVVKGEADDYHTGLDVAKRLQPDIVITDISLPDLNGIQLIYDIRKHSSKIQTMVISSCSDAIYIIEALKAGAMGYVLKSSGSSSLLNCLDSISNGQFYIDTLIKNYNIKNILNIENEGNMISDPSFNSLTKEEQQITRLMVGGIPDHVIANHMRMNLQEVLVFQKNISKTLAFSNPTDILKFAVRTGIINIDDW